MSNIKKTKTIKTSSTVCDKNDYYVIGFSNSVTFILSLIELITCFLLCWYNLSVHIIILSLNSSFLYVKMLFLMHFLLQLSVSHACNAWQQTATLTYTADSQLPLLLCSLFFRTKVKKMEDEVCIFDKFGFCRFKSTCKRKHFDQKCEDLSSCKKLKAAWKDTQKHVKGLLSKMSVCLAVAVPTTTRK